MPTTTTPIVDLPSLLESARDHATMAGASLRYASAALRAHGWNAATAELVGRALDFAEASTVAAREAHEALSVAADAETRVAS